MDWIPAEKLMINTQARKGIGVGQKVILKLLPSYDSKPSSDHSFHEV